MAAGQTMWMVNQFEAGPLTGGKRDRALTRARSLAGPRWHRELLRMIAETPEDAILENQIMIVPPLPRWTGRRVALIGDAAHGLSPHISAGGTLGIEDAGVLRTALTTAPDLSGALSGTSGSGWRDSMPYASSRPRSNTRTGRPSSPSATPLSATGC